MADQVREELSRQLGDDLEALARLTDDQAGELARALDDARRRQGAALAAATREALGHLPLPLRLAVRKVLGL